MKNFCKFLILSLLFFTSAYALAPEERLADEHQEQRAMKLFIEVKCLICAGQTIESSSTEFSSEMRKLIRKKISEGKSDDEIKKDLVKEFGDDILISTPQNKNILLWVLPAIFAFLAGLALRVRTISRQ